MHNRAMAHAAGHFDDRWNERLSVIFVFVALVFSAVLQFTPAHVRAQPVETASEQRGDDLDVAVITFGPGEEIWERFGHNAIEIRNRANGDAHLYNYGIFDFGEENFFLNFARGRMTYRVADGDPAEELPNYIAEGRWIVRQQLNLTPAQRAKLADFLAWNVREENARYRYDYFRSNCSTRVRDALDAALGGVIKAQTIAPSRGFTYRMDADRLMRPDAAVMLGIDAGLGPFADQRLSYWDESFVPMEFMRHLREIKVRDDSGNETPLVAVETQVAQARIADPPEFPPKWNWQALAAGVLAALLLLGLAWRCASAPARIFLAIAGGTIYLLLGIGGVLLLFLWFGTDHVAAWRNENLFLFDPLCLLLVPAWFASLRAQWRPSRFVRRCAFVIGLLAVFAWFAKILPHFTEDNMFWIAALLPVHLALAAIAMRVRALRR